MAEGHYVGVPIPSVIYIGCPDRADFDKIAAEAKDHGLDENGNHVLTKAITGTGDTPGRPVTVIFQHWLAHETTDHLIARHKREKAEREAASESSLSGDCG